MPTVFCPVVAGGGGWTAAGQVYPLNQNDGDENTYQFIAGNASGTNSNFYDHSGIPAGAVITSVVVTGTWGNGSAAATTSVVAHLGGNQTVLGTIGDVAGYGFVIARPGGGSWTRADIDVMWVAWTSLATGNGNAIRLRSSVLQVTYGLPATFLSSVFEFF